jgi:hypothetical protein
LTPKSWQVGRFLFTQIYQATKSPRRIAGHTLPNSDVSKVFFIILVSFEFD